MKVLAFPTSALLTDDRVNPLLTHDPCGVPPLSGLGLIFQRSLLNYYEYYDIDIDITMFVGDSLGITLQ